MTRASLRSIAAALDGEVSGNRVLAPGPGHSRRDRSLAVWLSATSPSGFIVHSYAGDDWQECQRYVCGRLGLPPFAPGRNDRPRLAYVRPEPSEQEQADAKRRQDSIGGFWREASHPRGTLVEPYLNSRGLDELPEEIAGSVIRFHPACAFGEGERHPCMIALMRNIATDEPIGIHRTALTPDGKKLGRKMLGAAAGAAIKLDADENVTQGLAIGEGVETCLAARQLGLRPVWALGSVAGIAKFPIIADVGGLHLLAENDVSGASDRAVEECKRRWLSAGREVIVLRPKFGSDANEALQRLAQ
jgi:putative DNA primase/helicase